MRVFFTFSPFYIEVMRVLNVAPTQIFTNSWGFIRDFEKVCEDLKATPIVRVFFSFYTTRLAKGRWVSLDGLSGNAHFTPHSNYKKKMEGKVHPCERARVFSWSVRGWWCPLSWMNDHVEITIYDKKYILISFLTWYKSSVWYPLTLSKLQHLPRTEPDTSSFEAYIVGILCRWITSHQICSHRVFKGIKFYIILPTHSCLWWERYNYSSFSGVSLRLWEHALWRLVPSYRNWFPFPLYNILLWWPLPPMKVLAFVRENHSSVPPWVYFGTPPQTFLGLVGRPWWWLH